MREIRLYGSEGGGAVCSPYPYRSENGHYTKDLQLLAFEAHRGGSIFFQLIGIRRAVFLRSPQLFRGWVKNESVEEVNQRFVNQQAGHSARLNTIPAGAEAAIDTMKITRHSSERLFRAAFRQARQRRGRASLIAKSNVLPMAYFRGIFDEQEGVS